MSVEILFLINLQLYTKIRWTAKCYECTHLQVSIPIFTSGFTTYILLRSSLGHFICNLCYYEWQGILLHRGLYFFVLSVMLPKYFIIESELKYHATSVENTVITFTDNCLLSGWFLLCCLQEVYNCWHILMFALRVYRYYPASYWHIFFLDCEHIFFRMRS